MDRLRQALLGSLLLGYAINALAETSPQCLWNVSGGLLYTNFISSTDNLRLAISPIETDSLHQHSQHNEPSAFISVKRTIALTHLPLLDSIQLGPALYYRSANWQGTVYEYDYPPINNETYELTAKMLDLMVESELHLHPVMHNITPFILAGAGLGYASLKYDETAAAGIPAQGTLHLGSHTDYHLTYELGAGISWTATSHLKLRLGYLYQGLLEHPQTGQNSGDLQLLQPLSLSLNNHSVFLSLSYSF